ncbi:MAG: GNAT family N-acetyltransferase [Cyclobacteriaceae bacterium]
MDIKVINIETGPDPLHRNELIARFLFQNLDEFGDKEEHILKAIEYVFNPNRGGVIILSLDKMEINGAVVINETGMGGYIPENILVYIAVHSKQRGKGLGKQLMKKAIENAKGDIALHVEPENPARYLYEKIGFTNKYLEMRFIKTNGN